MDDEATKMMEERWQAAFALLEQDFNRRLDAISHQIEALSEEVRTWAGQQGSNHLHLSGIAGDLAVRVQALEEEKVA